MIFRRFLGVTVALCLQSATALATDAASLGGGMTVGDPIKQPFGHHAFCLRQPDQCGPTNDAGNSPPALDDALMAKVAEINLAVNAEIQPVSDQILYGQEEYWTLPTDNKGDCEDYALLKRARLHDAGIPLSDLLLTVVNKRDGTGHAILTLRTASGDFVLDNLDWRVRHWSEVPYRFVKRQSPVNAGEWLEIESLPEPLVSSVSR
ncbi:transglutaminase-like cysteine peptidase [Aureimonas sp. AU22]|jgi:predicted transglutaminase-like cysteine proteinase|uniref:transglutaminase-like cysteine peptidase n=1 Tax=Aureimonas sp. AU22 TaxID=1638162 RepID=UPI0007806DC6|nr:transglutaminase-like cysteine peptidase [Aureimonas sp. AU22]